MTVNERKRARAVAKPGGDGATHVSALDLAFWRARVGPTVAALGTPCLIFAEEPLRQRIAELDVAFAGLPVRHWWSFKTLPLRPAVRTWHALGRGVEVVSEFELRAALGLRIPPSSILVNGPCKHSWLPRYPLEGLRVNLDSVVETRRLAPMARRCGWHLGLRLSTRAEENFEYPGIRAPFGLMPGEVGEVLRMLRRTRQLPEVLHCHLRTNVPEPRYYREAADEVLETARSAGWQPAILDLGGGFPPARVASRKGTALSAGFSLASMREALITIRARHRGVGEIWLENGRWLTASCGVLAVTVLEVKEGRGVREVICDGGRTMQAMVATWERHAMRVQSARRGPAVPTLVHGPTCMAFDNLGIHELPRSLRAGDVLIWFDAGAYQMSWETRFSHGHAALAWWAGDRRTTVRPRETAEAWLRGR
ncbi:MAG: hypothetical protein IT580_20445 [Verrucomicrobiales bacterium]|nr:hypothetical protein [Verrucomicrobiales bacterium]